MEPIIIQERINDYFDELMLTESQKLAIFDIGYFTSPASKNTYLCRTGGLAEHSLTVTEHMIQLNETFNMGIDRQDLLMTGLFHDIEKVFTYTENILSSGKQSAKVPYCSNPQLKLPKEVLALYLLNNDLEMKIPLPVATAISYSKREHIDLQNNIKNLIESPIEIILLWMLLTANNFSKWIIDANTTQEE